MPTVLCSEVTSGAEHALDFRGRLRAEISHALRRPRGAGGCAEESGSQAKQPLLRAPPPPPSLPAAAAPTPPPAPLEEVGLSDDEDSEGQSESLQEEPAEAPRAPRLTRAEAGAAPFREQVAEARRLLHALDSEVTRLTRTLKESRQEAWTLQQQHSTAESRIRQILAQHSSELDPDEVAEEKRLAEDEGRLRQAVAEWKDRLHRWYVEAKHQDNIVQQERDAQKGGDAHRILAKHPAGEVFLPSFGSDGDSDDGSYEPPRRAAPVRPAASAAARGRPQEYDDSSDSKSDGQDSYDMKQDQFQGDSDDSSEETPRGPSLPKAAPAAPDPPKASPSLVPIPSAAAATAQRPLLRPDEDEAEEVSSEEIEEAADDSTQSL